MTQKHRRTALGTSGSGNVSQTSDFRMLKCDS